MKIVNIILTSQNGGAEQVFADYTSVLTKLGHELLLIVKDDAPYIDKLETFGVKIEKVKNNLGYFDFVAIAKITKILQEFDADVVISHIGRSTVLARKAIKKITNKKVLQVAVNHSDNVKRTIGADFIFSVNKTIFFRTVESGQDARKSFVIPNAIDLSDAIFEEPETDLKIKPVIIIGAMARIDNQKGFDHLIKAIAKLETLNLEQKFILKIAGSGPFEEYLRSLVKKMKLENRVEFCGWLKDKKKFFQSIDIFCSASSNETFGLVLLEAMKYCKPIIATNTNGSQEILRDKIDGLIIEVNPSESLDQRFVDAILELRESRKLVQEIVKNSFIRLQEKFSYKSLEARMKEFFGSVEI